MNKIKMAESLGISRIVSGQWRLADWKLSTEDANKLINNFITEGITSFDHADIYGDYKCEELFGNALSLSPGLRNRIQLITKCGIRLVSKNRPENELKYYDTGKSHIIHSVEKSLQNYKTDYIDLLLIHRPDPFMNPEEVADAFSYLKRSGKVLYFGVSNFLPSQFNLLSAYLRFPLVTNQIEISPFYLNHFENGVIDLCQERGIHPMAWSPNGGGRLFNSNDEAVVRLRGALNEIMDETGARSIDQIVYAWLLAHPSGIIPIIGTGKVSRIKSAAESVDIKLSRQQWFKILQAASGREVD